MQMQRSHLAQPTIELLTQIPSAEPLATPLLDMIVETHIAVESEVAALRRIGRRARAAREALWQKEKEHLHSIAIAIDAELEYRPTCFCGIRSCRLRSLFREFNVAS